MPHTLLSRYIRATGRYDELLAAGGQPRTHWRPLVEALNAATPDQLRARQAFIAERIRENGITYNVYADPKGTDRPWALDALPFVLPADEWAVVERAVRQRADLLDRVMADLYGPQTLITSGALPAALIYGHKGFLWPCHGIVPPSGHFLHVYAADLARSPDGQWWVIADRTQGPSGAGYALENRLIVSRLFPEAFRDQRVFHLAEFFRELQDSLAHWAPVDAGETPFTVLLTPGPYNETYFEQAYLARYLGMPLVEGQDLTVRGNTVYLKTLSGLRRVHAILRRLDDDYADPLELRGESTLGVPGLVEAAQAGRVLLANALGSGVLQTAGLMAFLPALAERLLGEPLVMPAVATWWCGEASALDYVVSHLDELVIKPAYPSQRMAPVFGNTLSAAEKAHWIGRLRARPHTYIGQELVRLSQAPVLPEPPHPADDRRLPTLDRRLLSRAIGLRVYAVVTPDGWRVMPGGLTRVAGSGEVDLLSMQRGGSSKDTWVLSEAPVSQFSLLKGELGSRDIVRSGPQLASRTAENLFWLGRYGERVENSARLLRLACEALIEEGEGGFSPTASGVPIGDGGGRLENALANCELFGLLPAVETKGTAQRLIDGVHDFGWANSLASTLRSMLWAASQARERLSLDHWHALNRLGDLLRGARGGVPASTLVRPARSGQPGALAALPSALDRVLLSCISLAGFAMDDMTHDAGWRFLILGRRIERLQYRSLAVARFLESCAGRAVEIEDLLAFADSSETYRHRYRRAPDLVPTLDLVVFDPDNPHSVAFQIEMILRYLGNLERELSRAGAALGELGLNGFLQAATAALAEDALHEPAGARTAVSAGGSGGDADGELARRLRGLHGAAAALSNRLAERFFTHVAPTSRTLST